MISKGFKVLQAGPLALLQDAGRFGVRRQGVTQGGPADLHAWAWANWLVGNPWGTAALEITLGGLSLQAETQMTVAVAGADLAATLDDQPLPLWQTLRLEAGQKLHFKQPVQGLRAYLAVAGGWAAKPVLGSVATVVREGLGGFDGQGKRLETGDCLPIQSAKQPFEQRQVDASQRPDYSGLQRLQVLPGAQIAEFHGRSLFDAFNQEWTLDQRADRMGVRLLGPRLTCRLGAMVSEGISLGTVQVPPDGQPLVLLNDRQTIGGYPRLGNLTPLAASRLAQCLPGQKVRFQAQGRGAALREYQAFRFSVLG
ncbi:biotin-dependent carboxylase uncharacterized domain-containing protein [Marinospirillum celere]|uniref:Biotin-dependent carboxylase uncharacterized domain-containing protein n=1 Tax=Marinospirillum celere TaxID=1122252 RepID=A0A1I1E4K7_9GAMM|nr:biotin-dependent carboxyltransferase family protein [Marinospirillum celere]SFB81582.1 biotin-dependent carboxylase uncharacterized domain-containing protein [Marinospirillum celere]